MGYSKKAVSLILTAMMVQSVLVTGVVTASASQTDTLPAQSQTQVLESTVTSGDYTYTTSSQGITITKYNGTESELVIPEKIDGMIIAAIGESAFAFNTSLTSVSIPENVKSVGTKAFNGCSKLTTVSFPSTLVNIGTGAFYNCVRLESVTFPASVTSIGKEAFYNCISMTSLNLPSKLKKIEEKSFIHCTKITSVNIPSGVTEIGNEAFNLCSSVKTITIPNTVKTIGEKAFRECNEVTTVTIPASVTSIGEAAFSYCGKLLSFSVDSGNSNYASENGVLFNKSKTELLCCPSDKRGSYTAPATVQKIAKFAFAGCYYLKTVTLQSGVTEIGACAFQTCIYLQTVILPESLLTIGNSAFDNCGDLVNITLPSGVQTLGSYAFYYCGSLTDINIPATMTIGNKAFAYCSNLKNITVAQGSTQYASYNGVLMNKEKTEILIYPPKNEQSAFVVPDTVSTLKEGNFYNCVNLKEITIPKSVTTIEKGTFNSSGLTDVYYLGSKSQWSRVLIDATLNNPLVYATMHYAEEDASLSLDKTALSFEVGDMYTLKATYTPADDSITYTWKSNNTSVVTVNKTGRIVARGEGTAVVTVKSSDGQSAECTVTVTPKKSLTLDKTTLDMSVQDTYTLTPSCDEADVTYTFKSNNANVATVNKSGRIVARGEGTAVITVIASNALRATCTVTVTPQKTVVLDKNSLELSLKEVYTLTPSVSPADDSVTYTFKSSNTTVATVNKAGRIVARAEGTANITVVASNGAKAVCAVNVIPQKTLTLDKTELSMEVKEQYVLKPALSPADDTVTYTFKSSNATVASVNSSGRVVARAEGTATVTVRASNGLSAVCEVTVTSQPPVTQKIVYFNPKDIAVGNERWAVYTWNDKGSQWIDMTKNDNLYQFVLPDGYSNYIIVRMNGATTENSWSNKWNQSPDLVYSDTINLIIATGWGSNGTFTVSQAIKA